MIVVGIDPGKDWAVAVLVREEGERWPGRVTLHLTPTVRVGKVGGKEDYDIARMREILTSVPGVTLVVIEKQQAMKLPGKKAQGTASTFSTGWGFGLWCGLIAGLGLPMQIVHPRTWQSTMHRDIPGSDTKGRSILAAGRLFPDLDLRATPRSTKPHHGKADAILIAVFGALMIAEGPPRRRSKVRDAQVDLF